MSLVRVRVGLGLGFMGVPGGLICTGLTVAPVFQGGRLMVVRIFQIKRYGMEVLYNGMVAQLGRRAPVTQEPRVRIRSRENFFKNKRNERNYQ